MTDIPADRQNSYSYDDLIKHGNGELFGEGSPKLPLPNMLMMDRITNISTDGGTHGKGQILAELDINPDLWFFDCHFRGDPVMPGCLGLDAMWQLTGFYLGWLGHMGKGRALGLGEMKCHNQILPENKVVRYEINYKRVLAGKLILGIADGVTYVDDEIAYEVTGMKVGLFT